MADLLRDGLSGSGGGGGKKQRAPREAPNTLQGASKAKILDLIGFGPIVGLVNGLQSVYLDDTPVENADGTENFGGVRVQVREGYPDQEVIEGFSGVGSTTTVAAEVKNALPVIRTLTNPEADAVVVTAQVQGLYRRDTETGDTNGNTVSIAFDWRVDGGPWNLGVSDVISGKTMGPYPRSYRVDLRGARGSIDLRMRRVSPDYDDDSNVVGDTFWADYVEVIDRKLSYPDMALVALELDAKEFGNQMPKRSYEMYLSIIQVPSNYDPKTRSYYGLWDGTFKMSWSDNPAWAFYDLATHPVIGANMPFVDKWSLYRIGQYCDELVPDGKGGMEPRFTINTLFAEEEDAITALTTLASAFRGMVYWGSDVAVPVADMPEDPVKVVTAANVVGGNFKYSGTSIAERHSVAVVMYNDPNNRYEPTPVVYEDPESVKLFGWRETRVTAVGCTSRGQALRLAKWILYSERKETETVTYTASMDHADLRPGNIIKIADPVKAGARLGGRVVQTGNNMLELDQVPEQSQEGTWFLSVTLPDGMIERREIIEVDGNVVTLKSPLSAAPVLGAVWVLSSLSLELPEYRVAGVSEDGINFQITATEYHRSKYAEVEHNLKLDEVPESLIPTGPIQPPSQINVGVGTYLAGGAQHQRLMVSWPPSADARVQDYLLELQGPGDVAWRTAYHGPSLGYDELDAAEGQWMLRVRASNGLGVPSQWVTLTTHIEGLLRPVPPTSVEVEVGSFSVSLRPRALNTNAIYEFWRSTVALEEWQIESSAVFLTVSNNMVDVELSPDTQYFYYIRGVNAYGTSSWYPVQAKTKNDADEILKVISGKLKEEHLYQHLVDRIGLIDAPASMPGSVDHRLSEAKAELERGLEGLTAGLTNVADRTDEVEETTSALTERADVLDLAVGDLGQRAGDLEFEVGDLGSRLTRGVEDNTASIAQLSRVQLEANLLRAIEVKALEASSQGNQAGIINESVVSADRDGVLAKDIEALAVDLSTAQTSLEAMVAQEREARADELEAEATDRSKLAAQLRGTYTGSDLSALSSGLLFQERQARVLQGEAFTEQLSLISAGVGEQFDPLKIDHFEDASAPWTGGTAVNGWFVPTNGTGAYIQSPAGLGADGTRYNQVRLRVRRKGSPVWDGELSWRVEGSASWQQAAIDEPTYDLNGIGLITVNPEWAGTIDQLRIKLSTAQSSSDGFTMDWVAVGRPSPGASSAALAEVQQASAAANAAETQARETLSAVLTGSTDPEGLTLDTLTSGLIFSERAARVSDKEALAREIDQLRTSTGEDISAAINAEREVWSDADAALTRDIETAQSTATAAGQAAAEAQGAAGEAVRSVGVVDARVTTEVQTLAQADQALARSINELSSSFGDDLDAAILAVNKARADADMALTEQVETAQSTATSGVTKADAAQKAADDVNSRVTEEVKTLASADQALSESILGMSSELGEVSAGLTDLSSTFAQADRALSEALRELLADVEDNSGSIRAVQRVTAETNLVLAIQQAAMEAQVGANQAGIFVEQTVRATADESLVSELTQMEARVGEDVDARIQEVNSALAESDAALTQLISQASAGVRPSRADGDKAAALDAFNSLAKFESATTLRVTETAALAQRVDTLQVEVAGQLASVQEEIRVGGGANERLEAMWAIRVDVNGYVTGIGLANDGEESTFAVRADTFYVADPTSQAEVMPFIVQNGQTYINSALIGDATIQRAMIADAAIDSAKISDIQSSNYRANATGWKLWKEGAFEINGSVAGQGRMKITNDALIVYDSRGVKRVQIGNLSV